MTDKQKDRLRKSMQEAELNDAELDDVAGGAALACEAGCQTCETCQTCANGGSTGALLQ